MERESNLYNLTSVAAVIGVRKCLLIDYVTILLPSIFAGGKKSISSVGADLDRQTAGERSIITAVQKCRVLRSEQPDGNRSSSLVLSDSRGCGQRGRHG